MCGIIGYAGKSPCQNILLSGLYALEYRGYDSAGIALLDNEGFTIIKSRGEVSRLEEKMKAFQALESTLGIAHTRWATHGEPGERNAHPHKMGKTALVHNGIIENYREAEPILAEKGYTFFSDTDTERAAGLIDLYYNETGDPLAAISRACKKLRGSYAFAVMFEDRENEIYGVRLGSPLLIGVGDGENLIASDTAAFPAHIDRYIAMKDGSISRIFRDGFQLFDMNLAKIKANEQPLTQISRGAHKDGYEHFMRKEIHEEPAAVLKTLAAYIKNGLPDFSASGVDTSILKQLSSLHIAACGTAMHAGLFAKFLIEKFLRIPVFAEIASEFRYNEPIFDGNTALLVISQSGETADTLAALRLAKERGIYSIAVVNVPCSSIAREADAVIYTHAGREVSVASTKAYTVQTALLSLFALHLGSLRGSISQKEAQKICFSLSRELPEKIDEVIAREDEVRALCHSISQKESAFFIGRGVDAHICAEGALKLKEISYINAQAYPAGELKHGTISLISNDFPVIAVSTQLCSAEKTAANVREVASRGADVYLIAPEDFPQDGAKRVFVLPKAAEPLLPILAATVTQLLAYHTALLRGCNVDKPRNLAKSVTVE